MFLIAKKVGMTRMFDENGAHTPVTVLKVDPCVVFDHKTVEKHGYCAAVIGSCPIEMRKLTKDRKVFFEKIGYGPFRFVKEFRFDKSDALPSIGYEMPIDCFAPGSLIDVTGTTIGKGFAGVIKRHNFHGLRASHGVSLAHRSHGSTGCRQDPGKVFKNKKMAGHMGNVRMTQQSVTVFKVDIERGLILARGSVPGHSNSIVYISYAKKGRNKRHAS